MGVTTNNNTDVCSRVQHLGFWSLVEPLKSLFIFKCTGSVGFFFACGSMGEACGAVQKRRSAASRSQPRVPLALRFGPKRDEFATESQ